MDETAATETVASLSLLHAPLPTLPFDVIPKILCRLPVKLLIQLKCVCKSWKTLISDPKFVKKHLRVSKMYHHHHHLIVTGRDSLLWDSTISSVFSDTSTTSIVPQLQLIRPEAISGSFVSSCDGILLFSTDQHLPLLWNPSIRKFKILPLPPSLNPGPVDFAGSDKDEYPFDDDDFADDDVNVEYTFGYDHFIDNYKVFAITFGDCNIEVSVYTLGAESWRNIDDFPNKCHIRGEGMFVSGSVNWLAFDRLSRSLVIVSLDLEESYRKLSMPDLEKDCLTSLAVLRDRLCLFVNNVHFFDVWVMKEYGIEESWAKLFSIPYVRGHGSYIYTKVVYVYENDQVLLDFKETPQSDLKLVVYNSRNGTFKIPKVEKISELMYPEVYVESLISPCT